MGRLLRSRLLTRWLPAARLRKHSNHHAMIPQTVSLLAVSNKGRSRIGKTLQTAIVEQDHGEKIFVVFPELNQCRWILRDGDPDFRIIPAD